jgi:rSAM/selenodomain-associated transferase 1
VIFAKAPVAGGVKTRLARKLGVAVATRFARHAAAGLLARVSRDRRWHTLLATTGGAHSGGRFWPHALSQGGGDLGQRMQRILECMPPGPVVIVGTDIPQVRAAHIARAMRELGRHDVVFGPATDGGYWLVGLRRRPRVRKLFAGVRWSRADTLADTLKNLQNCRVYFLPELRDVDEADDLTAISADYGRRVPPALAPKLTHEA